MVKNVDGKNLILKLLNTIRENETQFDSTIIHLCIHKLKPKFKNYTFFLIKNIHIE